MDNCIASGRVPESLENTIVMMAVIGTARKVPRMPRKLGPQRRANGAGERAGFEQVARCVV